jgi:hypothetical protein
MSHWRRNFFPMGENAAVREEGKLNDYNIKLFGIQTPQHQHSSSVSHCTLTIAPRLYAHLHFYTTKPPLILLVFHSS